MALAINMNTAVAAENNESKTQNGKTQSQKFKSRDDAIKTHAKNLGLTVTSIGESPVSNLYQVMTDKGLFYFSESGKYLIQGRILDVSGGRPVDETEEAMKSVRSKAMKDHEDSMIVYKAKDEKFQVTVFTDISCGYCRKLHSEMADYNKLGITVRYLAFPRSGLSGGAFNAIKNVWCAKDQKAAMDHAKGGKEVANTSCKSPIAEHFELGQRLGVNATPALVFGDGSLLPGYQPPERLLQTLKIQKTL